MKQDLLNLIRQRSGDRCEYCRFPSSEAWLPFQVDHIIAEKHGGPTDESNLAFSCYYCNSYKGPNIAGIDPEGEPDVAVQLFHPRKDDWNTHFSWHRAVLVGRTPQARATISVLRINDVEAVAVRSMLLKCGITM